MPLVNPLPFLRDAFRRGYALPAFNVSNLELLQAVVAAAEAERAPVLVQFNPGGLKHVPLPLAAALGRAAAAEASVPVALHLDHCPDLDVHRRALESGFTSVMIDGSHLSFEENVHLTRRACDLAHPHGAPVEAELGHVGGAEEGAPAGRAALTDPDAARRFVEATGVDSLAVAIGTAHGAVLGTGDLDLDRLRAIRGAVDVPLVLHGASGVPDTDMREAVRCGIAKVNIATALHEAFTDALRRGLAAGPEARDPRPVLAAARDAVTEVARGRIRVLGASGRASAAP